MRPTHNPHRPAARGFTLIEVLVSLLVFSFGILGAVGMQAKVLQASTQNGDRGRASMLANEIIAEIWAQQAVTSLPAGYSAWVTMVNTPSMGGLPNGVGTVTLGPVNGVQTVSVSITWAEPSTPTTQNKFTTTVTVP